jgi:uncharacterized protein (DUF433 family)
MMITTASPDRLIQSHPNIMMGKPVVAGTRITVELILEKLAAGETIEQILEAHPRLTRKAIFAARELLSLSANPDFMEIIETSRKELRNGKKLSVEEMEREFQTVD